MQLAVRLLFISCTFLRPLPALSVFPVSPQLTARLPTGVARTLGTSLSGQARQTPHDDVDPYALAEAIEASLRERQRALDRLQAISPQQRESERLERIRSRDAARGALFLLRLPFQCAWC